MPQPLRAWIIADDVTVPAIAKGDDIELSEDEITLKFYGGGAELYLIASGCHYNVSTNQKVFIDGFVAQDKMTLDKRWRECQIDWEKIEDTLAFTQFGQEIEEVLIKANDCEGKRVVQLSKDLVAVSPDLKGKTVQLKRIPAFLPPAVLVDVANSKKVEQFKIAMIFENEYRVYSVELEPNRQSLEARSRVLKFKIVAIEVTQALQ